MQTWMMVLMILGMTPVNLFLPTAIETRLVRKPIPVGMAP